MKNKNTIVHYITKETRLFVIECSVFIEGKVSETLGSLLDIDWKNSQSLGFSSSSLSFNQKVNLIIDKSGLEKIDSKKLTVFMQTRNKFAHVKDVDTFEKLFSFSKSCKDIKKQIDPWYKEKNIINKNFEDRYKYYFLLLTLDIFKTLLNLDANHIYSEGRKEGEKKAKEELLQFLKDEIDNFDEDNDIWNSAIERLKKKGIHS